jgi:hypothetical protein
MGVQQDEEALATTTCAFACAQPAASHLHLSAKVTFVILLLNSLCSRVH